MGCGCLSYVKCIHNAPAHTLKQVSPKSSTAPVIQLSVSHSTCTRGRGERVATITQQTAVLKCSENTVLQLVSLAPICRLLHNRLSRSGFPGAGMAEANTHVRASGCPV